MVFAVSSVLLSLALLFLSSRGQADDTKDIQDQKLEQLNAQGATEEVVHRIGTMLRVIEFYQPDKTAQRKTLERVAGTLASLSREQMEDVLRRLDAAAAEPDPNKSAKELEAAHTRHVEIMQSLRGLLAEYENLSTLDLIAEKLDKLAKTELELSLQTNSMLKDPQDQPLINDFPRAFAGKKGGKAGKKSLSAGESGPGDERAIAPAHHRAK